MLARFLILLPLLFSITAYGKCLINKSDGSVAEGLSDALFLVLTDAERCPVNVRQLRRTFEDEELQIRPTMVANRGRNNPQFGSFSFFEEVRGTLGDNTIEEGQFFFGHFTTTQRGLIVLDQAPRPGKLLVELIAWDYEKGYYNFYELIGTASAGQWFYRGDSQDALLDNEFLHRTPASGKPKFGSRMRCSACHTGGGPIMKELDSPHNAWWSSTRPLPFAAHHQLSRDVAETVDELQEAGAFARSVTKGIRDLNSSEQFANIKKKQSLQEELRPLFCTVEINLASDQIALDRNHARVTIPSGFWVNPLLAVPQTSLPVAKYKQLLKEFDIVFPETNNRDADHGWLTPTKGTGDLVAIQQLMETGTIDEEFVTDVLAIDFTQPLLSEKRCQLLKLVPPRSQDWQVEFRENLKGSSQSASQELLANLTANDRTAQFHKANAEAFASTLQEELNTTTGSKETFERLVDLRNQVFRSEISQNPRGQILEPGFRVIFPVQR